MKKKTLIAIVCIVAALLIGVLAVGAYHVWQFYYWVDPASEEDYYIDGTDVFFGVECQDFYATQIEEYYKSGDKTPLDNPVEYRILWLGYENVAFEKLQFTMNDTDVQYLKNVVENFEKSVEKSANNNVDIIIDLYFFSEQRELTYDGEFLYLDRETIQQDIDKYNANKKYDSVISTVQSEGEENSIRQANTPGYEDTEKYWVILGLKTHGVACDYGYSTFNLCDPTSEFYDADNPSTPSLYATCVAVHEWLHQFEEMNELAVVDFPDVHAYMGGEEYSGYEEYQEGQDNLPDYYAFYDEILSGSVPYTDPDGNRKLVGMYPKAWEFVKCTDVSIGQYTIRDTATGKYLGANEDCTGLILTDEAFLWNVTCTSSKQYTLSPSTDDTTTIGLVSDVTEGGAVALASYSKNDVNNKWGIYVDDAGNYFITFGEEDMALEYNDDMGAAVLTSMPYEQQALWQVEKVS